MLKTYKGVIMTRKEIIEQPDRLDSNGQISSKNYWEEYRNFWDSFVEQWFNQRPNEPTDTNTQAIKRWVKELNFDELPEPYLGVPDKGVKAVIINLNPGMSQTDEQEQGLERQKFYKLKDIYSGNGPFVRASLIKEFSERCQKRYSKFVGKWSCLDPRYRKENTDLCGVKWWQGVNPASIGGRLEWLTRIYEKEPDVATSIHIDRERTGELNPLEVFALELCPYHSKSFNFKDERVFSFDNEAINFIVNHVLQPALKAVIENPSLPFAVAIGKPFAILLEKIGSEGKYGIAAKLEKEWCDESGDVEDWEWPKAKIKNTYEYRRRYRKYCLFVLKDREGRLARFLVCAAPGSNNPPGKDFKKIEDKQILPYIKSTTLTNELYEGLKTFSLRWWSYDGKKNLSKGASKKTRVSNVDRRQLYENLWNGFYKWCGQNNKVDFKSIVQLGYSKNAIDPSGKGDPRLIFKVAKGQLYLGIYCTVSTHAKIQASCVAEINAFNTGVNWKNGEDRKTWRCIPVPINGDWESPNAALFARMANAFERVGSILKRHGF